MVVYGGDGHGGSGKVVPIIPDTYEQRTSRSGCFDRVDDINETSLACPPERRRDNVKR